MDKNWMDKARNTQAYIDGDIDMKMDIKVDVDMKGNMGVDMKHLEVDKPMAKAGMQPQAS